MRKKKCRILSLVLAAAVALTMPLQMGLSAAAEEMLPDSSLLQDEPEPIEAMPTDETPESANNAEEEALPGSILAQDEPEPAQAVPEIVTGSAGAEVTYTLNTRTGLLTLSGTGWIDNNASKSTFLDYRDYIQTVVIEEGVTVIGDSAFFSFTNMTSVTIPDTVTKIGESAFESCKSLQEIYIPDSVTSLGSDLFYNCRSLTTVRLPEGLTEIPYKWGDIGFFRSCVSLTEVSIPDTVTSIGENAFLGCSSLSGITIPENVTSIGEAAFRGCQSLKSIVIPEGIKTLPPYVFYECGSLDSVTLPDTVTSIDECAFGHCAALEEITLPGGLTSIGTSAFANCTSLARISFPDGLTDISSGAFYGTAYMADKDGDFIFINDTILYQYCGSDTSVTIPEGVTAIAGGAFSNAKEVVSVTIPEGVLEIGAAFPNCTFLSSVTLPSTLRKINSKAFAGCAALEHIALPERLTYIGDMAFYKCTALQTVDIPAGSSLSWVGADAFTETPFLKEDTDFFMLGNVLYRYFGSERAPKLPEGTVSISPSAFMFNLSIEEITLPDTLQTIGQYAFLGCKKINMVIMPDSVTEIGAQAFGYYCDNGTSGSIIPYSFTFYGRKGSVAESYAAGKDNWWYHSFIDLAELHGTCGDTITWQIDVEKKLLTLSGTGAMPDYTPLGYNNCPPYIYYKKTIASVKIGDGITYIGENAFNGMTQLENVHLPDGLTAIGGYAFSECSNLASISIPDTVRILGKNTFSNDKALTSFTLPAELTAFDYMTFTNTSITQYQISDKSQYFKTVDGILYNMDITKLIAYPSAKRDTAYALPETVSVVGGFAFYEQQYLTSVTFHDGVTEIGNAALNKTALLKCVIFLGDAPTIGSSFLPSSITYCCYFDKPGWEELRTSMKNAAWIDLAQYGDSDEVTISMDKTTLQPGETAQLTAQFNPRLTSELVWSTDHPEIANVFADGRILANNTGTVTVTAAAPNGSCSGSFTLKVTGDSYELPAHEVVELTEDELDFQCLIPLLQIPCREVQGIYMLHRNELKLYSFITHKTELVRSFKSVGMAYSANNKLYYTDGDEFTSSSKCFVYDLQQQKEILQLQPTGYSITAVGADAQGRIYLAGNSNDNSNVNKLFLYNDKGELLSSTESGTYVYSFNGFDESSGNFYMETQCNFVYTGYDHLGHAATMGKVTDNVIATIPVTCSFKVQLVTYDLECISYLCQNKYQQHQNSVSVEGDHYLVTCSSVNRTRRIFDADTLQSYFQHYYPDVKETLLDGRYDTASVGTCTAYYPAHDSLITYEGQKLLAEYAADGTIISEFEAAHRVFSVEQLGSTVLLFEKEDGRSYLEIVAWDSPTAISISGDAVTLEAGSSMQLTVTTDSLTQPTYRWESSDPAVATVDQSGVLVGWKPGKAVITATTPTGQTADYAVTVTGDIPEAPAPDIRIERAAVTNNQSSNNYVIWADVIRSYLHELPDGTLERVEATETDILVETYRDSQLLSSRTLELQCPLFGGCFFGADYNFLVFGKDNLEMSNIAEVMRIVKYSKDWKQLGSVSVFGANTMIPFEAGTLRMAEADGKLYIQTCHKMLNGHQANMTFVFGQSDLEQLESNFEMSRPGYVAHCFAQFVRTDGEAVYRVDHGDGVPRGIALNKSSVDGSIMDVRTVVPFSIYGRDGDNVTGVSVGGFELSANTCIIAGNSTEQAENVSQEGQRNIFLCIVSKDLRTRNLLWITDYTADSGIAPATPQLVKISDHSFLLMWEEYNKTTGKVVTRMCTIDGSGTRSSDIITTYKRLSDCQPFYASDKLVKWYTTNGKTLTIYQQNPLLMQDTEEPTPVFLPGDVNGDSIVNASDAAQILIAAAMIGAGNPSGLTDRQWDAANVNIDSTVNASDAAIVLVYAAYIGAGGTQSPDQYFRRYADNQPFISF